MKMPDPDRTLVVATSGGKDSAAMALWLKFESGLPNPLRFVFNDTGHEHPMTLAYLNTLAESLDQEIERAPAKFTFESLAVHKKRFPAARRRFCTEELKLKPMGRWIGASGLTDIVLCQGVRAEESQRRAKMPVWDQTLGDMGGFFPIWRPIHAWTTEDVFAIHKRHDCPTNPLYEMGAGRVGCWPCIYVSHRELRNAFRRDPDLLPRLEAMEAAVRKVNPDGISMFFDFDKIPPWACDQSYVSRKDGSVIRYPSARAVHDYLMNPDQADMFADEEGDLADVPTCMSQYGLCE